MISAQRIYVAGHRGMVGSAIARTLQAVIASEARTVSSLRAKRGNPGLPDFVDCHVADAPRNDGDIIITRTHAELDLTNQAAVNEFFKQEQPTQVYLAAAKVGGIHANNTYPADFIYQNLMMQANVIEAAFQNGVQKLLFLGSSCIYPRLAPQPMREDALLTGPLEPTNEPYAIAKIAGIKLCESYNRQYGASHGVDYRSVMPTNLYGPGDNYHPQNSHVIPALIRRFHEAKVNNAPSVAIWGSGTPKREFLYVDDMAAASVFVMNLPKAVYDQHTSPMLSHINVGCGADITIAELAQAVSDTVGYPGQITFDVTQPDGAPRKLMDSTRLNALGWQAKVGLQEGLKLAYQDFLPLWGRLQPAMDD
jgi:GDP-L-fucose synthase